MFPENHPSIVQAKAAGMIEEHPPIGMAAEAAASSEIDAGRIRTVWFVNSSVSLELLASGELKFIANIPAMTVSEANRGGKLHLKIKAKVSVKEACRQTLGPRASLLAPFTEAYHAGKALRVKFTRLGGRTLDPANIGSACKTVEDMVAGAMLANDRPPLWNSSYDQEPGGVVGMRVEIEILPN
jgi:hypothetical protein